MIELLIAMLKATNDSNTKAMILQSYIAENGTIPDEYGEAVRQAMEVIHD